MLELMNVPRFSWRNVFGKTLTKMILELKISGKKATEAYDFLLNHPKIVVLMDKNPYLVEAIKKKIEVSILARYSENNTALRTYYELKRG